MNRTCSSESEYVLIFTVRLISTNLLRISYLRHMGILGPENQFHKKMNETINT